MYDIDVFPRLREAINLANQKCNVTTFYSMDEEEEIIYVHSKSSFLFLPEIPDAKLFLYTQPLTEKDKRTAEEFIRKYHKNIIDKWVKFFVMKQSVRSTNIKKKL